MMRAVEGGPGTDWPSATGAREGWGLRHAIPNLQLCSHDQVLNIHISKLLLIPPQKSHFFSKLSFHFLSVNYPYILSDLLYPLFHHHDYDSATILLLILPLST